jgi:hypothetical protein
MALKLKNKPTLGWNRQNLPSRQYLKNVLYYLTDGKHECFKLKEMDLVNVPC